MAINWSKSRKTHLDLAYGNLPYQPLTEENLDADLRFARIVYAVNHMPDRRAAFIIHGRDAAPAQGRADQTAVTVG